MTAQKHTPWAVSPHPWPEQVGCCPLVGRPYSISGTDNRNVAAANTLDIARLIAAAPDMLEALKMVMQHGRIDDSEERMSIVGAAIAKATGQ